MNLLIKQLGKNFSVWLASSVILIFFLFASSPLKLPLMVLLLPFAVFFIWVRSGVICASILLRGMKQPSRKLRIMADGIAAILLLVIVLQSLGQLSWRDLLLTSSLVLGLIFYLTKTDII